MRDTVGKRQLWWEPQPLCVLLVVVDYGCDPPYLFPVLPVLSVLTLSHVVSETLHIAEMRRTGSAAAAVLNFPHSFSSLDVSYVTATDIVPQKRSTSIASYMNSDEFNRMAFQGSAVVGDYLYIDGGERTSNIGNGST